MLDWARRETFLDVSINAVAVVILVFLDVLFLLTEPWGWDPLPVMLMHVLTLFPVAVLAYATYHVARRIERDEAAD